MSFFGAAPSTRHRHTAFHQERGVEHWRACSSFYAQNSFPGGNFGGVLFPVLSRDPHIPWTVIRSKFNVVLLRSALFAPRKIRAGLYTLSYHGIHRVYPELSSAQNSTSSFDVQHFSPRRRFAGVCTPCPTTESTGYALNCHPPKIQRRGFQWDACSPARVRSELSHQRLHVLEELFARIDHQHARVEELRVAHDRAEWTALEQLVHVLQDQGI